jgi:hypothetical protein
MKIISKLVFRVLMCSKKRCILAVIKKWRTQNFEVLKFFVQKSCKTQILKLGMAWSKLELRVLMYSDEKCL